MLLRSHLLILVSSTPFLFVSHRDRRDLHSFPTRRSSDLGDGEHRPVPREQIQGGGLGRRNGRAGLDARSEEHTSELQSLRHLVCRLLLEKKKRRDKRRRGNYR